MKKFNRILSVVLAVMMALSCAVFAGAANITFTDVANHWAWTNGQIPYLVEKGVLNGYKNDNGTYSFKPDGEVKRSEFIKMLDETFGLTKTISINYKMCIRDRINAEDDERLKAKIKTELSDFEKSVFDLYINDKSTREIAEILGREEKSVSNALYRMKVKIKGLLKN